ncbi:MULTISPECIES: DUF5605 domain-containing protein [Streptomyces]|uniref:DUF5605 domain-containing protein n=1 Tax=Streptomyces TaxID=1883 RepID=UPI0013C52D32
MTSRTRYRAESIGTRDMTVTACSPGDYECRFTLTLPDRPYFAVRRLALDEQTGDGTEGLDPRPGS